MIGNKRAMNQERDFGNKNRSQEGSSDNERERAHSYRGQGKSQWGQEMSADKEDPKVDKRRRLPFLLQLHFPGVRINSFEIFGDLP